MNIIWQRPDGSLAVSTIFDGSDPAEHAALLHERGDIPADWTAVAFGKVEFPANWPRQEDWRFVDGQIIADPALVKAMKWESIKAERHQRKAGGIKVTVSGTDKYFHSDTDSRIQYLGLKDRARDILAAGGTMADPIVILGQPVVWKTMDGSFVPITVQIAFDIVAGCAELDALLFGTAEGRKAVMEASADPAAYDASAGWPAAFGEQKK